MAKRVFILLGVLAVTLAAAAPTGAGVRTYPGCGATLAACIASSPSGTTIRLRTNNLIAIPDELEIAKGLTLEPAPGYKPRIGRTGTTLAEINFTPSGGKTAVVIRGIRFRQANLSVEIRGSAQGHRIVIANNSFQSTDWRALAASYGETARGSILITGNAIVADSGMEVSVRGGPLTISGNSVRGHDLTESELGISLGSRGSGTVRATIASNVITNVSGCHCGINSALSVRANDQTTLDARIVNNTIADSGLEGVSQAYGIALVSGSSNPDSQMNVKLYNHVVSNVNDHGIWSWQERVAVTGDMNDSVGSAQGDNLDPSDQVGTLLSVDPGFADPSAGDYRLGPPSELRNAGATCIQGLPLPRADAAGMFRLAGAAVDLGAYERGSSIKGTVRGVNRTGTDAANKLVGTRGRDILCGLGGKDRLEGRGGGDFLFGGLGSDSAFGGPGPDRLDLRDGFSGNDLAAGGDGRDTCLTDAGDRRRSC